MAKAARNVASEQKPFCKRLLSLAGKYSIWEIWSDFINAFALAISNSVDKPISMSARSRTNALWQSMTRRSGRFSRSLLLMWCPRLNRTRNRTFSAART